MLPLTENQIKISNEYFNLRINQEEELKKFKNSQDKIKKEIKDKLKAKRYISTQLIDNCIKISKYVRAKSNDVDSIFNTIVNSLEQNSNKSKYIKNEELIREYINTILNCKLEMLDIKQQLKIEFNKFKRTHREEIDYDILNILYKDNTNSIEYYNKNEISAEEFKATKEMYCACLKEVIEGIFDSEISKIDLKREERVQAKLEKEQNLKLQQDIINEYFNITEKPKSAEEELIYSALLGGYDELSKFL